MKRTTELLLCALLAITIYAPRVQAQIRLQPTSQPTVTAENEPWYQMREPVIFAGEYYYPAGPAIHFLPNEMVPSGLYRGRSALFPHDDRTQQHRVRPDCRRNDAAVRAAADRRSRWDNGEQCACAPGGHGFAINVFTPDSGGRSSSRRVDSCSGAARGSLRLGLADTIAREHGAARDIVRESIGWDGGPGKPFPQHKGARHVERDLRGISERTLVQHGAAGGARYSVAETDRRVARVSGLRSRFKRFDDLHPRDEGRRCVRRILETKVGSSRICNPTFRR